MILVVSLGGILTFLIVIGVIYIVGYIVLGLLGLALGGVTSAGDSLSDRIKSKRFYDHCIKEGIILEDFKNKDLEYINQRSQKIDLIGQLYNIKNPDVVFRDIYIAKHLDDYPEEKNKLFAQKQKKRHKHFVIGLGIIIGAIIGVSVYAIALSKRGFSTRLNGLDILSLLVIVVFLAAMCSMFTFLIDYAIHLDNGKKQKEQEIKEKLKQMNNK